MLSPHFDDAALSAAVQLMRPGAQVLTVFGGPPAPRVQLSPWDRLSGATSSLARYQDRVSEDRAAMSGLGVTARQLAEPEVQYREGPLSLDALASKVRPFIADASEVWIPAGMGGHADHLAVRAAAIGAAAEIGSGVPVWLYADQPYSIPFGWPTWVTGERGEYLDPDAWFADEMAARNLSQQDLEPYVVTLDAGARARKEQAVLAYPSQLPALQLDPGDRTRWRNLLSHELAWRYPAAGPVAAG